MVIPILLFSMNTFGPFMVFGFHWNTPCKSSLVGYFLLEECYDLFTVKHLDILILLRRYFVKIVTYIVNVFMWNLGASCTGFMLAVVYIVCPIVHQKFIQFLQVGLNDIQNIFSDLRVYRQVQILNILYNHIQKNSLGVEIICAILGISTSLSFMVANLNGDHDESNVLVLTTYCLAISNSLFALVLVVGRMVTVSLKNERYLNNVSKLEYGRVSRKERLWIKQFWRSCAKTKIQFGENNFLERLAPLRCLDYAVNLAVQFLLVSRAK